MKKQKALGNQFAKGYVEIIKAEGNEEDGRLGLCIISTETVDRQGDEIMVDGWDFKAFKKNPVMLWSHNSGWGDERPSIGRCEDIKVEGGKVTFTPVFDMADEFAAKIYRKFKDKFLNAFSIGFRPLEYQFTDTGVKFIKQEALEFSAVNVPANAEALVQLRSEGIDVAKDFHEWATKKDGAIAPKNEPKPLTDDLPKGGDEDDEEEENDRKEGWKSFSDVRLAMIKTFGELTSGAINQEQFTKKYGELVKVYKQFGRVAPQQKHFELAIIKVAGGLRMKKKVKRVEESVQDHVLHILGLPTSEITSSTHKS